MTEPALAATPRSRRSSLGHRASAPSIPPIDRSSPATSRRGGAARSSTRCTSAASPTRNGDGTAISPASAAAFRTCASSASTRSGSRPGTCRPWRTAATTSPTTAPSTRRSAPSRRPRRSSPKPSQLGIRTIIDVVPNHVSRSAPVVPACALAAGPGAPERDRFWFRPGLGPDGAEPPTTWPSEFKGGRTVDADDGPRWRAGRVVPAPVHGRTAGPQLGPPGRPRRARSDPALLVRPWGCRRPHRLRGPARQGRDDAGGPGRSCTGRPSDPRP